MGCRCKRQWKRCTGLLQNDCLRWHGCGESGSYGWCQVESGCRNTWDYCVGQGEQEDPKVEMASETPAVLLRICLFLGVALLAASAVLWMCKFRMPPRPQPPALMDPPAVELRTQRRQSH
ncbi:unnamed protein product [Effrenium voratum]|uniref:Uncharacterized protein n=1 Tax=Effrenium voratum TaxID=2562239 RepID=A0AA36HP11_9DINO|nr:unnamed protein product [Effrenium voratum]CAJ1444037.1 unnamed protein product [Effrenium voratum]